MDIIATVFKVTKALPVAETAKLELLQQVSAVHMRIIDGVSTLTQMLGLCAKLTATAREQRIPPIPDAV